MHVPKPPSLPSQGRHSADLRGADFLYFFKAAPPAPRGAVSDAAASARAGRAASGRSPLGARLRSADAALLL